MVAMVLSATVYISCSKEEKANAYSRNLSIKDFDIIGKQHNNGLNYVFTDLKELVNSKKKSIDKFDPSELKNCIDKSVAKYNATINNSSNEAFSNIVYKNVILKQTSFYTRYSGAKNDGITFLDSTIISLSLTPKQKELLFCLSEIFKNESYSIDELKEQIGLLVIRVDNEIPTNEEAAILYCALSIGINSLEYWNENFESWRLLSTQSHGKGWFNCQDLVNDDMAGGISGGAVGALVGGTATLGTMTVPAWVGGAAVGAVGSSSYNALKQVFDHFWGDGTK